MVTGLKATCEYRGYMWSTSESAADRAWNTIALLGMPAAALLLPGILIRDVAMLWPVDVVFALLLARRVLRPELFRYTPTVVEFRKYYVLPYAACLAWLIIISVINITQYAVAPLVIAAGVLGRARPLVYLFVTGMYIYKARSDTLFWFAASLCCAEAAVAWMQAVDALGVNAWLTPRYRLEGFNTAAFYLEGRRVVGTIGNPNSLGSVFDVFGTMGLAVAMFNASNRRRVAGVIMFVSSVYVCVVAAKTRQGTVGLAVGAAVLCAAAVVTRRYMVLIKIAVIAIAVSLVVLEVVRSDDSLTSRFGIMGSVDGVRSDESVSSRFAEWPSRVAALPYYGLVGGGMGAILGEVAAWDSGWLQLLAIGGVLMVILYARWLLRLVRRFWNVLTIREWRNDGYAVGALGALVVSGVNEIVNTTFGDTKVAVALFVVIMVGAAPLANASSTLLCKQKRLYRN